MKYPWFKTLNHNEDYKEVVQQVINNNKMTMGPNCYKLENDLRKMLGFKHIILTTSGTSALMMATLSSGLKSSDLVYSSNYTWVATINPSLICGAKIVTIDTAESSFNVNYKKLIELIKNNNPKLVIITNLNGQSYIDNDLLELKRKKKFILIEDCAQSLFVKNNLDDFSGKNSDVACYSLSITKLFNMVYGGFCGTDNDELAAKMIAIRNNGVNAEPENARLEIATSSGLNLKPNDLNAAIGVVNFKNRKYRISNSKKIFNIYLNSIKNKKINLLNYFDNEKSIPLYASALVEDRENFAKYCEKNNIGIHMGLRALHETNLFQHDTKDYQNSIKLSQKLVRLPSGPGYKESEINEICNILNKY